MKILYLILPLILIFLPSCYRIKFDNEFNHLNILTHNRLKLPLNMFSDPVEEQRINQVLIDGITRNDAIEIALKNNKKLQALFQSLGVSKSDVVQSSLFTNPTISISVLYPSTVKQQQSDNAGLTGTEIVMDSKFKLSDLWLVSLRENISRDELELQIYKILNEILETIKSVREIYDNILSSKSYIEYGLSIFNELEQTEKILELEIAKIDEKLDEERVNKLLLSAQIAKFKYNVITDNKTKISIAYAALRDLLGVENPTSEKINIKDDLFNLCLDIPKIEWLLDIAHTNHPEIFIALLNVKKAENKIKYEEACIVEDVSIGVASAGPDPILTGAGPAFDASIPILDQNQAQRSKAYFELVAAQKELEAAKTKVTSDVYKKYEKLLGALDKVGLYKKLLKPYIKGIEEKINSSKKLLPENVYFQVKFDLYDSYTNYIDSLKEFLTSFSDLERAIGHRLDVKFDHKCRVVGQI